MKRVILSAVTSFVLCLSSFSFAFATPQDVKMEAEIKAKKEANVKIVKSKGIKDEWIEKVGDDIDIVAGLIQTADVNETQIMNLINGLTNTKYDKGTKYEIKDGVVNKDGELIAVPNLKNQWEKINSNNNSDREKSETVSPLASYETYTGAHYVVTSYSGYNKASGWFRLPNVNIASGSTDAAYGIGGIFTPNSGADLGVYTKNGTTWYTAINMGQPNWTSCPENSSTCGWHSGSKPIYKSEHPKLYLVWKASDGTAADNYNHVEIQVYNGDTYDWITSMGFYAPGRGFNSNGTGLTMKREHSLACMQGKCNLSNGSYSRNSKWGGVYIYNPWTTASWTSSYTASAEKQDTEAEKRTITLHYSYPYYEDEVSINFNLP